MSKLWDASKVVLRRKSVAVMLTLGDITKAHNNELKSQKNNRINPNKMEGNNKQQKLMKQKKIQQRRSTKPKGSY